MSEAKNDPLSSPIGLSSPSDREWGKYYKAREKVNFIQLDINRLYLNDIEDSYFEDHDRRMALQNILVLWSTQHEETAYRQGMHELVGALYYVVEAEAEGWMSCIHVVEENGDKSSAGTQSSLMTWGGHPFRTLLTRENVEAHTFWLFERIMKDLECLYDPNSTAAGHPPVLHFCLGMQGSLFFYLNKILTTVLNFTFVALKKMY